METRVSQNALVIFSSIELCPRIGDGVSFELTSRDPRCGIRDIVSACLEPGGQSCQRRLQPESAERDAVTVGDICQHGPLELIAEHGVDDGGMPLADDEARPLNQPPIDLMRDSPRVAVSTEPVVEWHPEEALSLDVASEHDCTGPLAERSGEAPRQRRLTRTRHATDRNEPRGAGNEEVLRQSQILSSGLPKSITSGGVGLHGESGHRGLGANPGP